MNLSQFIAVILRSKSQTRDIERHSAQWGNNHDIPSSGITQLPHLASAFLFYQHHLFAQFFRNVAYILP